MLHYPATHFERLWRKRGCPDLSRPSPSSSNRAGITISATFRQFALAEIWLSPKFVRVLHGCQCCVHACAGCASFVPPRGTTSCCACRCCRSLASADCESRRLLDVQVLASSSHMDWTSEKCWCMVCVLVEIISFSLHPAQSKNLAKGLQMTFQRTRHLVAPSFWSGYYGTSMC